MIFRIQRKGIGVEKILACCFENMQPRRFARKFLYASWKISLARGENITRWKFLSEVSAMNAEVESGARSVLL